MESSKVPITVLLADDDDDDRLLLKDAFRESRIRSRLIAVDDGEELMSYLRRTGKYQDHNLFPEPGLILLDLNMPRKDGREAMAEIKADPLLRHIPIVVFTTSKVEEDIVRSYGVGASSYITKPFTFESLVDLIGTLGKYWLEIVELPGSDREGEER